MLARMVLCCTSQFKMASKYVTLREQPLPGFCGAGSVVCVTSKGLKVEGVEGVEGAWALFALACTK